MIQGTVCDFGGLLVLRATIRGEKRFVGRVSDLPSLNPLS